MVLRVTDGKITLQGICIQQKSLDDLVQAGHLMVVDAAMSQWLNIATHWSAPLVAADACEIHMQAMLGLAATLIPRIECNQSPRNSYQSAMTKQSVGVWEKTVRSLDTNFQFLVHTEKPLLQSNLNCGLVSAMGQNVMIAVSSYSGCNQNDAIVMSQGAIDNGLFASYHATVVKVELRGNEFLRGVQTDDRKKYHKLHPITGVVNCGVVLQHGDGLVLFHKKDSDPVGTETMSKQLRLLKHEEAIGTV
jgi:DNA-directed RNA polymerase subunit B